MKLLSHGPEPCASANSATGANINIKYKKAKVGAGGVTRTRDLRITNALHYQLCYTSIPLYYTNFYFPSQGIMQTYFIYFIVKGVCLC